MGKAPMEGRFDWHFDISTSKNFYSAKLFYFGLSLVGTTKRKQFLFVSFRFPFLIFDLIQSVLMEEERMKERRKSFVISLKFRSRCCNSLFSRKTRQIFLTRLNMSEAEEVSLSVSQLYMSLINN